MFKSSLNRKILLIIAATLFVGFAGLGVISIYLEYTATIDLQKKNARQLASTVTHDLLNQMTKGDMKDFGAYVAEIKTNGGVNGIKLFNVDGKEWGGDSVSDEVRSAIASGSPKELSASKDGKRFLDLAVPLLNEERCRSCHSGDAKLR